MNLSHLIAHRDAGKLPRTVALTGSGPSLVTMQRLVTDVQGPEVSVQHVWPRSAPELADTLSSGSLSGHRPFYVLHDVLPLLTEADIPLVERVLVKRTGVSTLWVGEKFSTESVQELFRRSIAKTYEAGFGTSEGQRKAFVQWVQLVSGVADPMARYIADACDYDEERAYNVSQQCAVLGGGLTAPMVTALVASTASSEFVSALIDYRLGHAARAVRELPAREIPAVLSRVTRSLRLMSRVYPAVQKFPAPGLAAAKATGVPIPTLTKFWAVAGKYSPQDVSRQLVLVSQAADRALGEGLGTSALLAMVLAW